MVLPFVWRFIDWPERTKAGHLRWSIKKADRLFGKQHSLAKRTAYAEFYPTLEAEGIRSLSSDRQDVRISPHLVGDRQHHLARDEFNSKRFHPLAGIGFAPAATGGPGQRWYAKSAGVSAIRSTSRRPREPGTCRAVPRYPRRPVERSLPL